MVPGHPRWREFIAQLSKVERCDRTTAHAREVLGRMSGVDVERSLRALERMGGYCDCAIVFDLAACEAHETV